MRKKVGFQAIILVFLVAMLSIIHMKFLFVFPVLGDSLLGNTVDYLSDTERYIQSDYQIEDHVSSVNLEGFKRKRPLSPDALVHICNAYLRNEGDEQFSFSAYPKEALYYMPIGMKYLYLRSRTSQGKITPSKAVVIDGKTGQIFASYYLTY